jgi:hypothetical protein
MLIDCAVLLSKRRHVFILTISGCAVFIADKAKGNSSSLASLSPAQERRHARLRDHLRNDREAPPSHRPVPPAPSGNRLSACAGSGHLRVPEEYFPPRRCGPHLPAVRAARCSPRPKAVRVEQPAIKMPLKPKAPGEITNPVPELLADSSLRPGDMVMFPDGLRVFTGRVGNRHQFADFEPVSQAGKTVPRVVRNLLANLRPGKNSAWNAQGSDTSGKLASNARSD